MILLWATLGSYAKAYPSNTGVGRLDIADGSLSAGMGRPDTDKSFYDFWLTPSLLRGAGAPEAVYGFAARQSSLAMKPPPSVHTASLQTVLDFTRLSSSTLLLGGLGPPQAVLEWAAVRSSLVMLHPAEKRMVSSQTLLDVRQLPSTALLVGSAGALQGVRDMVATCASLGLAPRSAQEAATARHNVEALLPRCSVGGFFKSSLHGFPKLGLHGSSTPSLHVFSKLRLGAEVKLSLKGFSKLGPTGPIGTSANTAAWRRNPVPGSLACWLEALGPVRGGRTAGPPSSQRPSPRLRRRLLLLSSPPGPVGGGPVPNKSWNLARTTLAPRRRSCFSLTT